MSTLPFDPEDPRLTAYALGELTDPTDCAQVEQLIAASPEARAELADIRALTAALTAEYEEERATPAEMSGKAPANTVPLPVTQRRPSPLTMLRPWLQMAAILAVVASGVWLALPAFRSVQVRSGGVAAPFAAKEFAQAAPMASATPPPTLFAQKEKEAGEQRLAMNEPITLPMPTAPAFPETSDANKRRPEPFPKPGETARDLTLLAGRFVNKADDTVSLNTPAPPLLSGSNTNPGSVMLDADRATVEKSSARNASGPEAVDLKTRAVAANTTGRLKSFTQSWATAKSKGAANEMPPRVAAGVIADDFASDKATETEVTGFRAAITTPTTAPSEPDMVEPENVSTRRLLKEKSEQAPNTADYAHTVENKFLAAKENPLSTFSIDVDTASYSLVRRFIDSGSLPPKDAVRVEELLNYFPYADAPPAPDSDKPFAIHLEAAACPWDTAHRLVRIGIKGKEIDADKRPPSNLVFLLDVSGSMMPPERLPLIKQCLHLLVEKMREDDHVAIVVYAGESGLALPSTSGDHKDKILHAIDNLHAGGSTNGASGIKLAYQMARKGFIKGGTNRVILSTDGDFNVGVTSHGDLLRLVEEERKDNIFLSVLGVGTDNLKDSTMQTLADHGNGNYAYLDRLEEGKKVLVDQMSGTLVTIAKDVKIQVEFNPAMVAAYRLIGYEKRLLRKEDFNDDKVDAGEIGAGHSVTALYEVIPAGQPAPGAGPGVDALKYRDKPAPVVDDSQRRPEAASRELLTVKMRHKAPDSDKSERSYEESLVDHGAQGEYANASPDFQFAAAVASFGLVLRDSAYKGNATLGSALELAQAGKGEDPGAYRAGFIELVRQAQALQQGDR